MHLSFYSLPPLLLAFSCLIFPSNTIGIQILGLNDQCCFPAKLSFLQIKRTLMKKPTNTEKRLVVKHNNLLLHYEKQLQKLPQ